MHSERRFEILKVYLPTTSCMAILSKFGGNGALGYPDEIGDESRGHDSKRGPGKMAPDAVTGLARIELNDYE